MQHPMMSRVAHCKSLHDRGMIATWLPAAVTLVRPETSLASQSTRTALQVRSSNITGVCLSVPSCAALLGLFADHLRAQHPGPSVPAVLPVLPGLCGP
jgi:hypothetical protein